MNQLPTEINILGTTFVVKLEPLKGEDLCGDTSMDERIIRICSDLPFSVQVETLYHEIQHAIHHHLGLAALLDDKVEEALAQGCGMAWSYIITANDLPTLKSKGDVTNE